MTESLMAGKVVTLPTVGLFADGAAVRTVGDETFRVSAHTWYYIGLCALWVCPETFFHYRFRM
jgi:threonine dehydratase